MKNLGTPQNFFIVFRGKSINNSHEFCSEAATRGILKKKGVLHRKTPVLESIFNKVTV